jgi:hypothetical protein
MVLYDGQNQLREHGCRTLDLSRICAAPGARLSHFPFEGDRAFPALC